MKPATSEALMACLAWFEENVEYGGYGFFPGGDPRSFTPGTIGEECTQEEHDAWKAACGRATAAGTTPEQKTEDESPACVHTEGAVLTRGKFGLGSYTFRYPDMDGLITKIKAALVAEEGDQPEATTVHLVDEVTRLQTEVEHLMVRAEAADQQEAIARQVLAERQELLDAALAQRAQAERARDLWIASTLRMRDAARVACRRLRSRAQTLADQEVAAALASAEGDTLRARQDEAAARRDAEDYRTWWLAAEERVRILQEEAEPIKEQLAAKESELCRMKEREKYFAQAISVADGGQYRADWTGAINRLIDERDRALEAARYAMKQGATADIVALQKRCDLILRGARIALRKMRSELVVWRAEALRGVDDLRSLQKAHEIVVAERNEAKGLADRTQYWLDEFQGAASSAQIETLRQRTRAERAERERDDLIAACDRLRDTTNRAVTGMEQLVGRGDVEDIIKESGR